MSFLQNVALTKLAPHLLYYYYFHYFSLLSVDYAFNKVSKTQPIRILLFSTQLLALDLPNQKLFS